MADFCKQCSADMFPGGSNDFEGMITEEKVKDGYYMPVLCEGCGPTGVDHEGRCINVDCLKKHKLENTVKCYQCEKDVHWLASDSRCKDCTRLTPEEVRGDE